MKNVEISTRSIPYKPRSNNYSFSGTVINTGGGTSSNGSDPSKLDKSVWEANFEELTDNNGAEYLYLSKPIVMAAGATMYAGNNILVPSIFEGLPLDQTTIGWNNGRLSVLGNIGGGISSAPITGTGNAITSATLSADGKVLSLVKGGTFLTEHQSLAGYAKTSDIPSLAGYVTESWVNNKGYLVASSQDKTNWNTAFDWGDHATAGYAKSSDFANYVTLATEQEIAGAKTFTADTTAFKGITIGGVSVKKSEDGVLILDGNLLITGGVTMHALGSRTAATIMDGVLVDGTTIVKQDGKLVVVGGGGSSVDMTMVWTALAANTSEQINVSHIPSLDWSKIGSGKPTTLAGYGITDALPLTGGTVTGYLEAPNFAANVNGVHAQKLLYLPNSTYSVGVTTRPRFGRFDRADGSVVLQLGNGNVFDIVDSNWGRTVARFQNANIPLIITSTNTGQSMINFCADSDGLVGQVGWHNSLGSFLYNNNSNKSTLCVGRVTDINSAIEYRHAGSTFYALYGEHNTALAKTNIFNFTSAINLLSLDQNKWYPCWVSVNVQTVTPTRIVIHNALQGNKPTWATHANGFSLHVDMEFITSGWGTMTTYVNCLNYEALHGGETAFGGTEQNTSASDQIVWLRGGGYYYYWVSTGQTFKVGTTGYSWTQSGYNYKRDVRTTQGDPTSGFKGWRSAFNSSNIASSMPYLHFKNYNDNGNAGYVGRGASNINDIFLIAYNGNNLRLAANGRTDDLLIDLNGNVTTPNRLQASRIMSTNIRIECDNTGILSGQGHEINNYNSHLYLQHHTGNHLLVCNGGGLLGVGVTNPSYKLHVGGRVFSNDAVGATNYLYSLTAPTFYNSWVNIFRNTATFNISTDQSVSGDSAQLILGWQNVINNGVGYRTTYRIGSSRETSGVGRMCLWIGNNDTQDNGKYLMLSAAGNSTWTGNTITNGIFKSVSNGITSTFGAQNSSHCHIYTTASLFYMDKSLNVASLTSRGNIVVTNIELISAAPFIDFHFGSSTADFTSRLYESASGRLQITSKLSIGYVNDTYALATGSFICASWIRTTGATGWYNETYGGGIYQADADQVRVYNNKVFYNEGYRVWGVAGHNVGLKLYQASHIGINLANNSYTWGIYSNNNGNLYFGRRNGNVNDTSGSYYYVFGAGLLSITGNLLLSGGSTMHGSDITKKNVLSRFVLPLNQIANAPLIRYRWKDNRNNRINIGGSAQYTNSLLPECAYKVGDTWSMDYATTAYAFAVSTAVHLADYIKKQATKEDERDIEIRALKRRIEILERRIA